MTQVERLTQREEIIARLQRKIEVQCDKALVALDMGDEELYRFHQDKARAIRKLLELTIRMHNERKGA